MESFSSYLMLLVVNVILNIISNVILNIVMLLGVIGASEVDG